MFEQERLMLRPLGREFDGYVEKAVRVSSTCLVQYDTNQYSVPCEHAKQRISLRIYAAQLAPFEQWALPKAIITIKKRYLKRLNGDRDFVALLLLIQTHDMDTVTTACELAIEAKTTQLSAITNLINRLTDNDVLPLLENHPYPQLEEPPQANCARYDTLLTKTYATAAEAML